MEEQRGKQQIGKTEIDRDGGGGSEGDSKSIKTSGRECVPLL